MRMVLNFQNYLSMLWAYLQSSTKAIAMAVACVLGFVSEVFNERLIGNPYREESVFPTPKVGRRLMTFVSAVVRELHMAHFRVCFVSAYVCPDMCPDICLHCRHFFIIGNCERCKYHHYYFSILFTRSVLFLSCSCLTKLIPHQSAHCSASWLQVICPNLCILRLRMRKFLLMMVTCER